MIKKILLKIYYWPCLSPERADHFQKIARDCEWKAIKMFIKKGEFLDVGCGAGYAMVLAMKSGCKVKGIDPDPLEHGVGRRNVDFQLPPETIIKAGAEKIPFPDCFFDTVYSSHVLEHVNDSSRSLQEINRVTAEEGVIIIGVPTSTMARIRWLTEFLFITHQKIINVLFSRVINTGKTKWWEIFVPVSHSGNNKTIFYDLWNYRTKRWLKMIAQELMVVKIIYPCLYPYPEYKQLFKLHRSKRFSSSVFFICKKKDK